MEVQEFYQSCKGKGLKDLSEVAESLARHEFDSKLVNSLVENSKGELAAVLAPYITAAYMEELSDRANEILNLYTLKTNASIRLMRTAEEFRRTAQQNNFARLSFHLLRTKHGPKIVPIATYGNGPIMAQIKEDKGALDRIKEELKRA